MQSKFNDPSDFEHPDRFQWMDGVMKDHPAGVSITSMEVWHAVLGQQPPPDSQPHAFFAFRDEEFIQGVDEDWQWIFDFEYLPEDAKVRDAVAQQYTKTALYDQYKADLGTITKQIRGASSRAKYFDYEPSEPIVVKETGRLPTGKRFGTGSVGGLEFFAEKVCVCVADKQHRQPARTNSRGTADGTQTTTTTTKHTHTHKHNNTHTTHACNTELGTCPAPPRRLTSSHLFPPQHTRTHTGLCDAVLCH